VIQAVQAVQLILILNYCRMTDAFLLFYMLFRHKFLAEFLEVGGVLTVLEILGLKQAKEVLYEYMLCMN